MSNSDENLQKLAVKEDANLKPKSSGPHVDFSTDGITDEEVFDESLEEEDDDNEIEIIHDNVIALKCELCQQQYSIAKVFNNENKFLHHLSNEHDSTLSEYVSKFDVSY